MGLKQVTHMVHVIWLATAWHLHHARHTGDPVSMPAPTPPRYLLSPGLRRVECLYDLHLPSHPVTNTLTDTQPSAGPRIQLVPLSIPRTRVCGSQRL